jgi:hypothetical protein
MNAPRPEAPAAEWLVFADSLQSKGDPRGELIALADAGDLGKRDAHVKAHADALLGPAAKHLGGPLTIDWKWGFIDSAEIAGDASVNFVAVLETLLGGPHAEHLRSLTLTGLTPTTTNVDLSPAVQRAAKVASLQHVRLVDKRAAGVSTLVSRDYDPEQNLVNFGSLDPLWALPALRSLEVVMADVRQLEPGTIRSSTLTDLKVHGLRFAGSGYGDGDPNDLAQALGAASLPALASLDLRLCEEWTANVPDDSDAYRPYWPDGDAGSEEGADDGDGEGALWGAELGPMLAMLAKSTTLQQLRLTSFENGEGLLQALAEHGLPSSLEALDLSGSMVDEACVPLFEANAGYRKLKRLVVEDTRLNEKAFAALKKLIPEVIGEPGERYLPRFRYVVGME